MGRPLDRLDPLGGGQYADLPTVRQAAALLHHRARRGTATEPGAPIVRSFADTWPTLSVEIRRDVASALVTGVRVYQDKTVEILPRWGAPVTITFAKRGRVPLLPAD